eukprot:TRINITY_DN11380_c0_g1_i2.p2 TRINITY_DN11380_c0_g1~~TRINITY_DN11380_c0_g1_i2.p2  ORF type:complete len:400 (-),score=111.56 TRINITY_DN11380_c0_g1_i2:211-1410(-)
MVSMQIAVFLFRKYKETGRASDKMSMIISAAHMNQGFMQQLKAQQEQGKDLGSKASLLENSPGFRLGQTAEINPAKDGLTPAAKALANAPGQVKKRSADTESLTLGQTFANEIVRRMGEITDENGEVKDSSGLNDSLASTMDWLRGKFGDETAAAAAGMILQATSSGVTEDTLGEGMLNALKLIDRNFGIAAGDTVMAQFNGGINQALNSYFDNGKNELFFDAGALSQDGQPTAAQDVSARFFMQTQAADSDETDSTDALADILEELKGELDKIAALQDLTTQLEAEFNPAQASMQTAVNAYQSTPGFIEPQLTSVTVQPPSAERERPDSQKSSLLLRPPRQAAPKKFRKRDRMGCGENIKTALPAKLAGRFELRLTAANTAGVLRRSAGQKLRPLPRS